MHSTARKKRTCTGIEITSFRTYSGYRDGGGHRFNFRIGERGKGLKVGVKVVSEILVRNRELEMALVEKGYRHYDRHSFQSDVVLANYYRTDYHAKVPYCISNDKPPQFCIEESGLVMPDGVEIRSVKIGIINEAKLGWTNFSFYGIKQDVLLDRLEEFEQALLGAWASLFDKEDMTEVSTASVQ